MSTEQQYIATKLADEVIKKYIHMQLQNFLFHIPTKSMVFEGVHANIRIPAKLIVLHIYMYIYQLQNYGIAISWHVYEIDSFESVCELLSNKFATSVTMKCMHLNSLL